MADSVLERISKNVLSALGTVITDNGAAYTITPSRQTMKISPRHLDAVIIQGPPDNDESGGTMIDGWVQTYMIVVYIIPHDGDTVPIDTYNNAVLADIYKALMVDYTRGGLAEETRIKPPIFFPFIEGEFGGFTFQFDVKYRTVVDDPFTSAFS